MNIFTKTIDLGDGRSISIETGKLAKQADGAVVVRQGNTMLLATVVSAKDAKEDVDFMPLSVEYREKFAAAGRFPGGFRKREARPDDSEILTARLVDRALRPLFPKNYHAETFVTVELISAEKDIMPDSLAGLAASACIAVSDIPFECPISEVRVARVNGKFIINPSFSQLEGADIDIMVGATYDNIMMVEGEMAEVSEADMIEALRIGHEAIKPQCKAQLELTELVGKTKKREYCHERNDEELKKHMIETLSQKVYDVAKQQLPKVERIMAFNQIEEDYLASLGEEVADEKKPLVKRYYHDIHKEAVRNLVLNEKIRLDGRKPTEIRPIWCETDYLPMAHGSAIFTRGETQSLTSVTLGTKLDEQIVDQALVQERERFMLHYNFPPYSTGEARPNRGTGRREIGHGNLAHRALKRMLPPREENPYVVRVVSDILESNGSSSMATVCAGTLALMDAGVKIKKPVSGIAMGLITDDSKRFVVLSDILGDEDHLGDMDFKVCGTVDGITACQMDIKVDGLSYEILAQALEQARAGRMHIMEKITDTIAAPRAEYKPHVPGIAVINIPTETIGAVIGPGGKIIQEIQSTTKTIITIEEINGHGEVTISGPDQEAIEAALRRIRGIVAVPEVGEIYRGKVKSIVAFGAFVEIFPGKEGLLHISEIDHKRIAKVEDVLKDGQMVEVKLLGVDPKTGKMKLSMKALLPKPEKKEEKAAE